MVGFYGVGGLGFLGFLGIRGAIRAEVRGVGTCACTHQRSTDAACLVWGLLKEKGCVLLWDVKEIHTEQKK